MQATRPDSSAPAHDAQHEQDRGRDDARDRADAGPDGEGSAASRVGAAQTAAPSTRRWRRPGRFRSKR